MTLDEKLKALEADNIIPVAEVYGGVANRSDNVAHLIAALRKCREQRDAVFDEHASLTIQTIQRYDAELLAILEGQHSSGKDRD